MKPPFTSNFFNINGDMPAVKIEKTANGGAGIARLPDGRICFVEGALTGETAKIRIIKQKKDFVFAAAYKILDKNPRRREAPCPYYGKCGGCNAQHATFTLQVEMLKEATEDLFLRTAKIKLPEWTIFAGEEWGYRHRAQVFASGDKKIPFGFLGRESHNVIPVEKCLALSEGLNGQLRKYAPEERQAASLKHISRKCENLEKRFLFDNQTLHFLGRHIYADESVFFQSNIPLLPTLMDKVVKAAGEGERLLDIFCGIGLFSIFLQNKFKNIVGIEQNALCKKFAEKNMLPHLDSSSNNCNFSFYAENAEDWCRKNKIFPSDVIVIDPPRTGLPADLLACLCKNKAGKLIYVSCNPATLARDARKLLDAGYELANAHGFAFYPQTFHLEMLIEFQAY